MTFRILGVIVAIAMIAFLIFGVWRLENSPADDKQFIFELFLFLLFSYFIIYVFALYKAIVSDKIGYKIMATAMGLFYSIFIGYVLFG
ncbi:MAG: hypothetical protein JWO06_2943 [Bacteroidota bacterium]|nr:hypothetical protein [Bacteroidota bacterium]